MSAMCVTIYEDDDEPVTVFGVDDGDGGEVIFAFTPEVADEIADRLRASAAKVRARHPEGVQ